MAVFTCVVTVLCGIVGLFAFQMEGAGIILAVAAAAACIINELESLRKDLRDTRDAEWENKHRSEKQYD